MSGYLQRFIFPFVGLVAFASTVTAADLAEQRKAFLSVEKSLQQGQSWQQQWYTSLSDYPLFPYLEIQALRQRLPSASSDEITALRNRYPDLPAIRELEAAWLNELIRRKRWSDYVANYDSIKPRGHRYRCYLAQGLLATGKRQDAMMLAESLWMVGHSQPKACDPVFSVWRRGGFLTSDLAFKRFWLAVDEENIALARYVERQITTGQHKRSVHVFWKIRKQPAVLTKNRFLRRNLANREALLVYGVKRLARQDIARAIQVWIRDRDRFHVSDKRRKSLDQWLALRIARRFEPDAEKLINTIDPMFVYPEVTAWRIRVALADQNWSLVASLIEKLPDNLQATPRWRYWSMMAQRHIAQPDDISVITLAQLSGSRSFYGFLAAELNHSVFGLKQRDGVLDADRIRALKSRPAFRRIAELLALKRELKARQEWYAAMKQLDKDERQLAARLAHHWQWHSQAIMTAARESMWDELGIRFPVPGSMSLFELNARTFSVDPLWSLAVARQESAFYPKARSDSGARGLMQLMPATARLTARNYGIAYQTTHDLYRPLVNIALGTAYLADMKRQFDGNRVYATAAYNAGPGRVKRWIDQRGDLPLDVWIETIPFKETRRYVQNVLSFRVIFASLMGMPVRLFTHHETNLLAYNR